MGETFQTYLIYHCIRDCCCSNLRRQRLSRYNFEAYTMGTYIQRLRCRIYTAGVVCCTGSALLRAEQSK